MDLPVEQSTWAITFASCLFLAGILRGVVWLIQRVNYRRDVEAGLLPKPPASGLAPQLPEDFRPQWLDVGLVMLVGAICLQVSPIFAPVMMTALGVVLLRQRGVDVLRLWQWNPSELGHYFLRGADRYLLLFIPLTLVAGGSMLAFRLAGQKPEPQPIVMEFLEMDNPRGVIFFVILAVIVAPIWEEIVFRGILYPMFRGLRDRVFALLVTGFLFGMVHGHGPALIPLTFLGVALAWFYEKTGKLGYCIALHAVFNGVTATTLLLIKYAPNAHG